MIPRSTTFIKIILYFKNPKQADDGEDSQHSAKKKNYSLSEWVGVKIFFLL